jgi:hypothetical protein
MSRAEENDDDRPWTEAQWEEFMKRADARSAKFGELLETLQDHPDRDAIIDHEMGWDRRRAEQGEAYEEFLETVSAAAEAAETAEDDEEDDWDDNAWDDNDWDLDDDWDLFGDEEPEGGETAGSPQAEAGSPPPKNAAPSEGPGDYFTKRKNALKNMPAYKRSYQYGLRVHKALDDLKIEGEEDQDEDLSDAVVGALIISAKLAGGHGMGYEDDALCGNIVCCKRSLAGADQCLRGLRALRDRGLASAEIIDPLVSEGEQVRRLVEEHIAELRSRVWWE